MKGRARRRAERFGRWAEGLCVLALRTTGWRILARRFRAPVGEIDIVARRGRVVAFVEVKARRGDGLAPTPDARQRRRIARAAALFVARHPALEGCDLRFDLMVVRPWRPPRRLADAWRPNPAEWAS